MLRLGLRKQDQSVPGWTKQWLDSGPASMDLASVMAVRPIEQSQHKGTNGLAGLAGSSYGERREEVSRPCLQRLDKLVAGVRPSGRVSQVVAYELLRPRWELKSGRFEETWETTPRKLGRIIQRKTSNQSKLPCRSQGSTTSAAAGSSSGIPCDGALLMPRDTGSEQTCSETCPSSESGVLTVYLSGPVHPMYLAPSRSSRWDETLSQPASMSASLCMYSTR